MVRSAPSVVHGAGHRRPILPQEGQRFTPSGVAWTVCVWLLLSCVVGPHVATAQPSVTGVVVTPADTSLFVGASLQMTAIATYSDSTQQDVTASAVWDSDQPSVVYVDSTGVVLAIDPGSAQVTATFDAVASPPAALTVLPIVELEALPVGNVDVNPGSVDRVLLALRVTNHDTQSHELTSLRVRQTGPASLLHLRLDDGDGSFDPLADVALEQGAPISGAWNATLLSFTLSADETATLFVSADVSLATAQHGAVLDVSVENVTDLTWSTSPVVAAPNGFPIDSAGHATVSDLVLAQVAFTAQPPDTTYPGARSVSVLQLTLPSDGGTADILQRLDVLQIGSAAAGADLEALHLETSLASVPSPVQSTWQRIAPLVHTGANRWSASGLALDVTAGGRDVRIVADVAAGAAEGQTIRLELPVRGLEFSSGREGPVDAGWQNPSVLLVQAQRQLNVSQTDISALPNPVPRTVGPLAVMAFELTALSADTDTLVQLNLQHTSTGPSGPASDPDAQIERAELWLHKAGNGDIDPDDTMLATWVPGSSPPGEIVFGQQASLGIQLPVGTPVDLLVSMTPDSTRVRDGELLSVELAAPQDIVITGGLEVLLSQPLRTQNPPQVDGQAAAGYAVTFLQGRVLFAGTANATVLDFALPSNGVDDDLLEALRVENAGTATQSDVAAMRLVRDDGDGFPDVDDTIVASLVTVGERTWEATDLAHALLANQPHRYRIDVDFSDGAQSGRTFQARLPRFGVTVSSGNDGPNDGALLGGEPLVLSSADEVTWLVGVAGSHTVPPDADQHVVLVLEAFNGYNSVRTLQSVDVAMRGTVQSQEFLVWSLHDDINRNGLPDELPVQSVKPNDIQVRFGGFALDLQPLEQRRLLVTYSLAQPSARDASVINAVVEDANAFTYSIGSTVSNGSFVLDSPGQDIVDGHIRAQIQNREVSSQTLGGDERNVLALDLSLPSNGLAPDTLRSLTLELVNDRPAVFGTDVVDLILWRESDADWSTASFDPAQDDLVQHVVPGSPGLRFEDLEADIGVGGQRFYVSADIGAAPTDSVRIQLRLPVDGIEMASGNDGPVDNAVLGTAAHTISSSELLASASVSSTRLSRGQTVDLRVVVRNQGSAQLDAVVPLQVDVEPPTAATLMSGATPAQLDLAPAAVDTFTYRFRLDVEGELHFSALVGQTASSMQSNVAKSPIVRVETPPSGLVLETISSLPASVNRGQNGVTPLVWRLRHPDVDPLAADISIHTLRFQVEDAAGVPQSAASVFAGFEIRTGTLVHATWDSIPDVTSITISLSEPVVLTGGETRDLPLWVSIASGASAADFRLRLSDAAAVEAVDANSALAVDLVATLPWTTQSATIRTAAQRVDVVATSTLPAAVNEGQQGVPAGQLTFSVPGASGESEVRVTDLEFALRDSDANPVNASDLLTRVRVLSAGTALLETTDLASVGSSVRLPLAIPKVVSSGGQESIELVLDLLAATGVENFTVEIADSTEIVVRDANAGHVIPVSLASPAAFPWTQGPAQIDVPATLLTVAAISMTPSTTFPQASAIEVAQLTLHHADPLGSADAEFLQLRFRILDDSGAVLAPDDVLTAVRLRVGGELEAEVASPSGQDVLLLPAAPLRVSAGDSLQLLVDVDLAPLVDTPWLRFAFDVGAIVVRDANEPQRTPNVTGLPFSTQLMRVIAEAAGVSLGPLRHPVANVVRGSRNDDLLPLRIEHPGVENEASITAPRLVVTLRDVAGAPLGVQAVASAAHVRVGDATLEAIVVTDSLIFDLSNLIPVDPGAHHDLSLGLDVLASTPVQDFRVAVDAAAIAPVSEGGTAVPVSGLPGFSLPYVSPTIHVGAATLGESFSSYPNPYTPGTDDCNITFFLENDADVTCDIYALSGERVLRLLDATRLTAGLHDDLVWNGYNGNGELVRNGTYLLRLHVDGPGGGEFIRRLAVIR
jgi:hypothetical protein